MPGGGVATAGVGMARSWGSSGPPTIGGPVPVGAGCKGVLTVEAEVLAVKVEVTKGAIPWEDEVQEVVMVVLCVVLGVWGLGGGSGWSASLAEVSKMMSMRGLGPAGCRPAGSEVEEGVLGTGWVLWDPGGRCRGVC